MTLLQPPSFLQNRTDHTAQEDRLYLAGVMHSFGGIGGLAAAASVSLVRAQASPNMTVLVAKERFFMPGTENTHQGIYHGYNDADATVTIAASSPTLPRIDIVYAAVRDQFYSGANNDWVIDKVTGTPAGSPVAPAAPANAIVIANIAVAANATTVTNGNITNNAQLASAKGGVVVCSSVTRPAGPYLGMKIYETDTDTFLYCSNTTGPVWSVFANQRVDHFSSGSDVTSSGTTEVVGYSHSVALVSGRRYRVTFQGYILGGANAGTQRIQLRYDAAALTITSTAIGTPFGDIAVSTSNGHSVFFWREFVASGSGAFNLGAGVRTGAGGGNAIIQGSTIATEIDVDAVTE